MVTIETFPAGPLGCNCSIIVDEVTKKAICVDPGGDFDEIAKRLARLDAHVEAIVHTHTHIDHVGATYDVQRTTHARACIHEADRFLYDMLGVQAAMLGINEPQKVEMEGSLVDGQPIVAGNLELGVLHTPGHTPGSVCFVVHTPDGPRVFSGDTLFRRSIGRTDLWGGDGPTIVKSLRHKLFALPGESIVIPGHGPTTTIDEEKRLNPFVR